MNEIKFLRYGAYHYFHGTSMSACIHKCMSMKLEHRLQQKFKARGTLRTRFFRSENWHGMFS